MLCRDTSNQIELRRGKNNRGVLKTLFGFRKVILEKNKEGDYIKEVLPGTFKPDECLDWMEDE